MNKERDAAHEILRLHQQSLQQHEAYFAKMEQVMNAQARHIEILETQVAALIRGVYLQAGKEPPL